MSGALHPTSICGKQRTALGPGTRLGPYEITDILGTGGMGEVYRAGDTRLKRDVALKIFAPTTIDGVEFENRILRDLRVVHSQQPREILQGNGAVQLGSEHKWLRSPIIAQALCRKREYRCHRKSATREGKAIS